MTMDQFEKISKQVLVLCSPDEAETMDISRRLREAGVQTTLAANWEEARQILSESLELVGAIMIPTEIEARHLRSPLRKLIQLASPEAPQLISFGEPPDKRERKRLRKLGIRLAIWAPLSQSQIRSQINRALNSENETLLQRDNPRVPTHFDCLVTVGERQKEATVYSLAATGAFLETPRSIMTGAKLTVCFEPTGHRIEVSAEVVYANVPGNLQRPMLPLGMGVHFSDVDKADTKFLKSYITDRIHDLEV